MKNRPQAPPAKTKAWRGITEADIQPTCTEYLELDGWRALRTDPCSDRSRAKGFGELGMADHLYIRYSKGGTPQAKPSQAEVLWVEYKGPKGEPSQHQMTWHYAERARGALTVIMGIDCDRSIEGFLAWYRASGLNRGKV